VSEVEGESKESGMAEMLLATHKAGLISRAELLLSLAPSFSSSSGRSDGTPIKGEAFESLLPPKALQPLLAQWKSVESLDDGDKWSSVTKVQQTRSNSSTRT